MDDEGSMVHTMRDELFANINRARRAVEEKAVEAVNEYRQSRVKDGEFEWLQDVNLDTLDEQDPAALVETIKRMKTLAVRKVSKADAQAVLVIEWHREYKRLEREVSSAFSPCVQF